MDNTDYKLPLMGHYDSEDTAYWENFLTADEMGIILSWHTWNQKKEGKVFHANHNDFEVVNQIRKSQVAWFESCEENQMIWAKLTMVVAEVNRRYFHLDLNECEPAQLAVYKAAKTKKGTHGFYDWHWDLYSNKIFTPRKLSMSLLLNKPEDFEGGELQIMTSSQSTTLTQAQGRAWFFPSYTVHRVTPVTQGERRSMVIWATGPAVK